jgi:hypothetical protein
VKVRQPVDGWYWALLLEACGNRCGCCGKHQSELRQPLQRGHIKLHSEGGDAEPENIMPVCLPCNNTYKKSDTPFNHLPTDYLTRLAVLLLRRINPKYRVYAFSARVDSILQNDSDENKTLVSLQADVFGDCKALYTRSRHLPPHAVNQTVQQLISESRNHPNPPNYPNAGRLASMREFVRDYGTEVFLEVGRTFLNKEMWITPDNRFMVDSWSQLVDGFNDLHGRWRHKLRREEEQRKRDAEEAVVAADQREKDAPKVFALLSEKIKLQDIVRQCRLLAEGLEEEYRKDSMASIRTISYWIDEQTSVESLAKGSHRVHDLYEDLKPTSLVNSEG